MRGSTLPHFFFFFFFVDTVLQLPQTIEQAKENFKCLVEISRSCGLESNKNKSNIMKYNMQDQPQQIEGINVTSTIKYLGPWCYFNKCPKISLPNIKNS